MSNRAGRTAANKAVKAVRSREARTVVNKAVKNATINSPDKRAERTRASGVNREGRVPLNRGL